MSTGNMSNRPLPHPLAPPPVAPLPHGSRTPTPSLHGLEENPNRSSLLFFLPPLVSFFWRIGRLRLLLALLVVRQQAQAGQP
jgi:hypothetical protein